MAAEWMTVLKLVPWSDVISNAPKIAEGAKKLWDRAAGKPGSDAGSASDLQETAGITPSAAAVSLDAVAARQALLEQQLATQQQQALALQAQMRQSAELLNELATQNARLIEQVDRLQRQQRWLGATSAALAVGLLAVGAVLLR